MKYYAQLNIKDICVGVCQTTEYIPEYNHMEKNGEQNFFSWMMPLESYDASKVGQTYDNGEWVETVITDIRLDTSELILQAGDTQYLNVFILPEGARAAIQWQSDNADIATVDDFGLVTGVSDGATSISLSTEDGSMVANCTVTVMGKKTEEEIYQETIDNLVLEALTGGM